MRKNKSVAILDVRSNEISFLLGSRGVNNNFSYSGNHVEKYEGFCSQGFFDEESFRRAVVRAIGAVRQAYDGTIDSVYVGVPAAFVSVVTTGRTAAFNSKRKITAQDIDAFYESGLTSLMVQGRCIRKSAMYFTLGDNRKYFSADDLYGVPTNMLKGALCYYFVSEYFYSLLNSVLNDMGFTAVEFIPSTLAQSIYLLDEKKREGYGFLLDIGYTSSSISVVYGDGIVHEESFDFGVASVLVALMQTMEIDFAVAEEMLGLANISGGNVPKDLAYYTELDERAFSVQKINDVIKCGLDELCEKVDDFLKKRYKDKATTMIAINPISITGEGISCIKGAAEHIAKRVGWLTEIVSPDLPYYDKPTCSSRIALLSMALSNCKSQSWWERLFYKNGGKRK